MDREQPAGGLDGDARSMAVLSHDPHVRVCRKPGLRGCRSIALGRSSPMKSRQVLWSGLGTVGLFGAVGGAWLLSLPPAQTNSAAPSISKEEVDALLAALEPPKRRRPLIAIIGINNAIEHCLRR